jgi:hypothetical protein
VLFHAIEHCTLRWQYYIASQITEAINLHRACHIQLILHSLSFVFDVIL